MCYFRAIGNAMRSGGFSILSRPAGGWLRAFAPRHPHPLGNRVLRGRRQVQLQPGGNR